MLVHSKFQIWTCPQEPKRMLFEFKEDTTALQFLRTSLHWAMKPAAFSECKRLVCDAITYIPHDHAQLGAMAECL